MYPPIALVAWNLSPQFYVDFANITEEWEDPEKAYSCSSITPELQTENLLYITSEMDG